MGDLIKFFIFMAIVILIIIIGNKILPEPEKEILKKYQNDIKVNGINIHLSDEEIEEIERKKEEERKQKFISAKENLTNNILSDLKNTEDLIRKKVLEALLKRKVENIDDYVKLDYLYNDGKLRSNEEVDYMERYFKYQKERENYSEECKKVNLFAYLLPFVFVFIITCVAVNDIVMGPVVGLLFGLIAALIGTSVGHSINIDNAEEYGINKNDPRVVKEINKRRAAIAAIIGVTITTAHHTKNAVKDVINVDSWKEMK